MKRRNVNITREQAEEHQRKQLAAGAIKEPGFELAWLCGRCGQKNAGWATECGRCQFMRGVRGKTLCEVFAEEEGKKPAGKLRNVRRREMNKTERDYSHILEAQKRKGELALYKFEGIRLIWGGGMTYTPDFSVQFYGGRIALIEVKGAHIRDRDTVRFKGCRNEWQEWFDFEFHQRKDGQWRRLL